MGTAHQQAAKQPSLNVLQFDIGANSADSYVNLFTGTVTFPLSLLTLTSRNQFSYSVDIHYQSNVEKTIDEWNLTAQTGVLGVGWDLPLDRIVVDTKSNAEATDDGYFLILNNNTQQLIQVAEENGVLSFELEEYQFWDITYTPAEEQWVIIKENGTTLTFGGNGEVVGDNPETHVLQYGIRWNNWVGETTNTTDQSRYITAWNLAKIENHFGSYCIFNYQVVEQPVGDGDLTYTKSCQLLAVQNDLGWRCQYAYLPMVYDASSLDAPKEYLQPYHDPAVVPNNEGDAYQSQYTTLYLDSLSIYNGFDQLQSTVQFSYYDLTNLTTEHADNPLAYGGTYKRYLKTITSYNVQGESKPGIEFQYQFSTDTDEHRGALTDIIYPAGGQVHFDYRLIELGSGDAETSGERNITVANPCKGRAVAKTWYGDDYVVVGWYDSDYYELQLTVYTWLGRWCQCQQQWFQFDLAINIDALQVATSKNAFVLSLPYASQSKTDVYTFSRSNLCLSNWDMQVDVHHYQTATLQWHNGDSFFLAYDDNQRLIDRFTWNWLTKAWQVETVVKAQSAYDVFYLTAYHSYYCILQYNQSSRESVFQLCYRDRLLNWYDGGSLTTSTLHIPEISNLSYCQLTPSDSFVALAIMTNYTSSSSNGYFDYSMYALQWDGNYANLRLQDLTDVDAGAFTHLPSTLLNSVGPVVMGNQLIGSLANVALYNGSHWDFSSLGLTYDGYSDYSMQYYWYAYGNNAYLKTENTSSAILSQLNSIDLNQTNARWQLQTLMDDSNPPTTRYHDAYPTLMQNCLSLGAKVYDVSVYSDWDNIEQYLIADLATLTTDTIDTTTVVNQCPCFLAFMTVDDNNTPLDTYVALYRNRDLLRDSQGNVVVETFPGQQMYRILNDQHRYETALNGRLPAIPFGFVSYPASDEDYAMSEVTLYRYSNESVENTLKAFAVTQVGINDGYATVHKCYEYDQVTAAQDASGTIARFQTVSEYAGCISPDQQTQGYIVSEFYNGLPSTSQADCYSLLDGTLISKKQYAADGQLVASSEMQWQVTTEVAMDPAETQWQNLYGGIAQMQSRTEMQDDVSKTTSYQYSAASGQVVQSSYDYYDSTGTVTTVETLTDYAYQYYADMWAQHLLDSVAKTTVQTAVDVGAMQVQSIKVSTYCLWSVDGVDYWDAGEDYLATAATAVPFEWWQSGTPSADWLNTKSVVSRDRYGHVLESLNVDGLPSSQCYDDNAALLLASFKGASRAANGISYDSFEDYQANTWVYSIPSAASTISSDAYTGKQCCALSQSGSLTKAVSLTEWDQNYVFAGWLKPSVDLTITLQISADGSGALLTESVTMVAGQWQYVQWVVDLSGLSGATTATLGLQVSLASGESLYVDNLFFTPALSQFEAKVYDDAKLHQTASLSVNGTCKRCLFDNFDDPAGQIGVTENVEGFSSAFLTRQTHVVDTDQAFPQSQPNYSLTVSGVAEGFYDQFKAGALTDYTLVNSQTADWQLVDQSLQFIGNSTEALGAQLQRNNFTSSAFGAYVLVEDQSNNNTISIGTGVYYVLWHANVWQLVRQDANGLQVIDSNDSIGFQSEWILLVWDGRLQFYANGVVFFDYVTADLIDADNVFLMGAQQAAGFKNLMVADDLRFSLDYVDGLNQVRQSMTMENGSSTLLTATLYDALGRAAIEVKPSRVTTTDVNNPFTYYTDYITNAEPDSSLWQGAEMTGPVSDRYHPEDEGYPFKRTVYEATPTQRPIAYGQPGKTFAITDDTTSWHVTQVCYGTNTADVDFFYSLPAGQYLLKTTTDPNGNMSMECSDNAQHFIGSIQAAADGSHDASSSMVYDSMGRKLVSIPPNYYAGVDTTIVEGYPADATRSTYNFLGQVIEKSDPDSGLLQRVYDNAGRVRFIQGADAAMHNLINYVKYDVLGRRLEVGYYQGTWNRDDLEVLANDPDWPTEANIWSSRYHYDGDNNSANTLGNLWYAEADNSASDSADVTDLYAYNRHADITCRSQTIAGQCYQFDYGYNAAGELLTTTDSTTNITIENQYNALGQLVSISDISTNQPKRLLQYTYTQLGALDQVSALPDAALMTRQYRYNSPGWMTDIDDGYMSEVLDYTGNGINNAGYYNGVIAQQAFAYQQGDVYSTNKQVAADYLYRIDHIDDNGQSSQWDMDNNGNFITTQQNGVVCDYSVASDSNRLERVECNGQTSQYAYTLSGRIQNIETAGTTTKTFAYYPGNGMTSAVDLPTGVEVDQVAFAYNAAKYRVLKTETLADAVVRQTTYVQGLGLMPELQINSEGATQQTLRFINSDGISMVYYEGQYYCILTDHLGSTRLLVNEAGDVVGQYDYDTYGQVTTVQAPDFTYQRLYTSQEFDVTLALYHYQARFYDATIGRFLSVDPAKEFFNSYLYVNNNPLMYCDPTGQLSRGWAIAISAVEIGVGVALTVSTGGVGAVAGSALIGAGLAGLSVAVTPGAFSDEEFGKAELIGGISGLAMGGVGGAFDALAAEEGSIAAQMASRAAGRILVKGALGGAVGAAAGDATSAAVGNKVSAQQFGIDMGVGAAMGIGGAMVGEGIAAMGTGSAAVAATDEEEAIVMRQEQSRQRLAARRGIQRRARVYDRDAQLDYHSDRIYTNRQLAAYLAYGAVLTAVDVAVARTGVGSPLQFALYLTVGTLGGYGYMNTPPQQTGGGAAAAE